MKTRVFSSISVFLVVRITYAANDWSVPCISGVCSYDLPSSSISPSGTLKMWGPQGAISDITPAAGWQILGCDGNAMAQDIRLICTSPSAPCDHLFANGGAEGKVVRLPENCGKNAFARVAKMWISEDQSIPARVATHFQRRDRKSPQVHALHFDTHFHEVDATKMGQVKFAIQAATLPNVNHEIDADSASSRPGHFEERGLPDKMLKRLKHLTKVNFNKQTTFDPINIDTNGTVFKETIDCPPLTSGFEVDMDTKAHAQVTLGVAVTGTIIPPSIEDFGIVTTLSMDMNGTMTLQTDALAGVDSGKIKIFEVGLPGLDFPGILSIGPSFQVNTQAVATLNFPVSATVGINYHLDQAQFVFPPRDGQDGDVKNFTLHDTPLKLSVPPSVEATGTVEGHVIPSLNLGVSAFAAQTEIYTELDSSCVLTITLEGNKPATRPREVASIDAGTSGVINTSSSVVEERAAPEKTAFNGCLEVDTVLDFNVGADSAFFNIIDVGVQVSFFKKTFQLFKRCRSNLVPAKRFVPALLPAGGARLRHWLRRDSILSSSSLLKRAGLRCLSTTISVPIQVFNTIIQASAIFPI